MPYFPPPQSSTPTGTAGGDLAGTYPNPPLNTAISTAVAFSGLGATTIADATQSTSSTTGSLKTAGGLGVVKNIYGGSAISIGGETISGSNILSLGSASGSTQGVVRGYGTGIFNVLSVQTARGTQASPTAVKSGDLLGQFAFGGYDTAFRNRGVLAVSATEDWTGSANGTSFKFQVTANGSTSPADGLLINNDRSIQIAGYTTAGFLQNDSAGTVATATISKSGGATTFGAAPAASPVAQTLQAQGSRAGTDSNVGGANLTVTSGNGTGTGTRSVLTLQSPVVVASGTGAQTQTTGLRIDGGTAVSTGYTVATLPATPLTGARAHVTDALAPTFLATIVGGGAITTPVFYNGTAWVGG